VGKLNKGDVKKKKRRRESEEVDKGGLKKVVSSGQDVAEDDECVLSTISKRQTADNHCRDEDGREAKARRAVRTNNFTQQTNALDVDKHMCVSYINSMSCRCK
jgi:hypothetical protein